MRESRHQFAALKRKIARIEGSPALAGPGLVPLGHAGADAALGGGLARGRLHELFALDSADASSGAGFAAMLALRMGGPIVWLRTQDAERLGGGLHAPGLSEIGIDPAALVLGVLPDARDVLRAGLDVVRCAAVGVAVIELWRGVPALDLTATRRLAVAAESSGVTTLLLRVEAVPMPSAAHTRWAVRAGPSAALEVNAPGHPAIDVELLRQRGRPAGAGWLLEWDRDRTIFREPGGQSALPGAVVPLSAGGPAGAGFASIRRAG